MLPGADPAWSDLPANEQGRAIEAAVTLLLDFSDRGWEPLLRQHVDDGSGHCRDCGGSSTPRPIWPCSLYQIARRAQLRAAGHQRLN
jgi:hypothetical protein